jgi:signal transduction histidine kinase
VLTESEQIIEALRRGEIDAVISRDQLFFLRLREVEEALRLSRAQLEQRVIDGAEEIARQGDQLRKLAAEVTQTEQRERARLAEVLHDHLQQLLVAVNMEIGSLRNKTTSEDTAAHLTKISLLVDDCIKATRILTADLAPPMLGVGGLSPALEWLAQWMQEKHSLQVALRLDSQARGEEEHVSLLLFQSVRELLFNVVKHAGVASAAVTMGLTEDARLRVIVSDEGVGFDPSFPPKGFGLSRIRERLTLLGGHFSVESEPGRGSRFVLIAGPPRGAS